MKQKLDILQAVTRCGSFSLALGAGRFAGTLISEECSVFFISDEGKTLLHTGHGRFDFDFRAPEDGELLVSVPSDDVHSSIWLREWEDGGKIAGWSDTPSFAQIDTKPRNTVSPEVLHMMEAMNRNMILREAALRAELQKGAK